MSRDYIYLDHAAATPMDASVTKAMEPFFSELFFNPSANNTRSKHVKRAIDDSRSKTAYWLGAKPSEIIFTAGASEANNLAIHGVMKKYPGKKLLYSSIEHESVIEPARQYPSEEIYGDSKGRLDIADLKSKIDAETVLVAVMYANNEIGTVQPLKEIAQVISTERKRRGPGGLPVYLFSDAAQAGNYLDLHASRLGIDMMSLNGGKIYGPKQSGCLYLHSGVQLEPLIFGGGQERGLRSGTENVASIVGFAEALDQAQSRRKIHYANDLELQKTFISRINIHLPEVQINGSLKYRLPNNLHLTFPGVDNERLLILLDENSIIAAVGSACSASNEESSHVLKAIGKTDAEARSSVRFTLGRLNAASDIEKVVETLVRLTS